MPIHLARILIYPVKSLPPADVAEARVLPGSGLAGDRQFAIFNGSEEVVNGKRCERIHHLQSEFSFADRRLQLWSDMPPAARQAFDLTADRTAADHWLTAWFGEPVHLRENAAVGFPDDTLAPGPTVISTATLAAVADWFGLSLDEVRRRFRANLEIGGGEPFWEDRLYGPEGQPVPFRIGEALLAGMNPCQRCAVPTRDSRTGRADARFAKQFASHRAATLPAWADKSRFDHFYRLAVNTRVLNEQPARLGVGDEVHLG